MSTSHVSTTATHSRNRRPRAAIRAVMPEGHVARSIALLGMALAAALALTALAGSRAAAQEWHSEPIEGGTKPALAVAADGTPVVVYMLERQDGWVRIASRVDGAWQIDEVASGYFYGPPDIAVGPDGVAHATFHDHQDQQFRPEKGDAAYLRRDVGGDWALSVAADPGHDGWDNRITVDAEGRPHMVAVDPLEFNGAGVEYYAIDDAGTWSAEAVGSGPQTYKYAVSVVVDGEGTPWVSYHDGTTQTLKLAHRDGDGWQIEVVDDEGETGFFSELALDGDGGLHVSYYQRLSGSEGIVKHAYRAPSADEWQISEVDRLGAVLTGFTGARNITSIDTDSSANPWIAYSDERVMKLARIVAGEWQIETVTEAGDLPLGQIVSLALDGEDRPHIAYAEVSNKDQLDGTVWYATKG